MNKAFQIAMWVGAAIGVPVVCVMTLGGVLLNPAALTVGGPIALAYVLVFVLLFKWSGNWPEKPWHWIPATLLWGAGPVFLFVFAGGDYYSNLPQQLGFPIFTASFAGAFPEEIGKAAGIVLALMAFKQFDRPWHGFLVGAFIGLGFTINENLGYGANGGLLDPASDAAGVARIWMLRTLLGPVQHAVYSGVIGWGIGLALFTPNKSTAWRVWTSVCWFTLGFGLHFVWNASPTSTLVNYATMASAAIVGYPLFFYLFLKSKKLAKAEQLAHP